MSLEAWSKRYEDVRAALMEQYFNHRAGLPYDKELMEKLSKELANICREFLENFNEPRSMYLACIHEVARDERLKVEIEFEEKRMEIIKSETFTLNGMPVNWGSWRKFNAKVDDPEKRKKLFDEFISKAKQLARLVDERMRISREVYARYGLTPLDAYLELEKISYEKLYSIVEKIGLGAKEAYLKAAEHYAPEILGKKKVEYYDDYYTWRGRIYRPLNKYFEHLDPVEKVIELLKGLNIDPSKIKVDAEDREKKSPSAFCFWIRVPDDVRVVYRRVAPFTDFGSVFHEFGHGLHGVSAKREDPVWKRYVVPMSVAETFSYLTEYLLEDDVFLKEELKLPEEAVREIIDRRRFMHLVFATFYAANSLMKIEFWKYNYTAEKAAERYQELTKKFFIEVPGEYWLLHHIMPSYDIYSPSYVVAAVRMAAIRKKLKEEFGEAWWRSKEAAEMIKEMAAARGEFDVKAWKLDPKIYLDDIKDISILK
ncbi:MAG: hypothetical protein DRJ26_02485 [Candidatus Methanomethylicota archaeon]|uniref:Peptidase M3A/M3B catalytic domain-containing protein n=1 Tax=Thermoproteota archaeon TaxID=2056631 RepID=A0A497F4S6_9CREN|nr:MAG: hypothetical protein DRJ26_02485 [Candidatus Verstraetearchaeota archaeon]